MCACTCICSCICICICICIRICICVRICICMCICIGLCACICICICIRRRYMFMHRNKYTRRCRCGLVCTHVNTRLCSHRHTSTTLRREAPESDISIVRHCPMFQCRTIKTGSCHYTPLRTYANTLKHFHAHTHTSTYRRICAYVCIYT